MQRQLITGLALAGLLFGLPVARGMNPSPASSSGVQPVLEDPGEDLEEDPDELPDEVREEVSELFARALDEAKRGVVHECTEDCGNEGCSDHCPAATSPRQELRRGLARNPLVLFAVEPLATEVIGKSSTSSHEAAFVFELLIDSRNPNAAGVAEGLYESGPWHFDAATLVAFCELGSKRLVEPLHAAVKKGGTSVVAATYLASQGDSAGERLLKKAVKARTIDAETALDVLVAAIGLQHLGDDRVLPAAQLRVCDAAIDALDAGDLELARSLAIQASVCRMAAQRSQMALSQLASTCAEYEAEAASHGELTTADDIFAVIEENAPIG